MNQNSKRGAISFLPFAWVCLACGCDGRSDADEPTPESRQSTTAVVEQRKSAGGASIDRSVTSSSPAVATPTQEVAPPQTQAPPRKPTAGIDIQSAERELVAKHKLGSDQTINNYRAPVSHSYYVTADLLIREDSKEPIPALQFWIRKVVNRGNRTDLHPSEYSWHVELTVPYIKDLLHFIDEFERRKGDGYQGAPDVRAEFNWLRLSKDGHYGESVKMRWPTFEKDRHFMDEYSPWIKADIYGMQEVLRAMLFRLQPDSMHGREMPLEALNGTWDGFADWGEVKFSNGSATYGMSSEYQFFKLQDDAAAEGKTQDGKMTVTDAGNGVFEGTWIDSPKLQGSLSIKLSADGELARVDWKSADGSLHGTDIFVRESSYAPPAQKHTAKELSIADLDGTWGGSADWGQVVLKGGVGTYSATYGGSPGQIHVKSLDVTGLRGTWGEDEKHHGALVINMSEDRASIQIEWSDGKRSGSSSLTKVQ